MYNCLWPFFCGRPPICSISINSTQRYESSFGPEPGEIRAKTVIYQYIYLFHKNVGYQRVNFDLTRIYNAKCIIFHYTCIQRPWQPEILCSCCRSCDIMGHILCSIPCLVSFSVLYTYPLLLESIEYKICVQRPVSRCVCVCVCMLFDDDDPIISLTAWCISHDQFEMDIFPSILFCL